MSRTITVCAALGALALTVGIGGGAARRVLQHLRQVQPPHLDRALRRRQLRNAIAPLSSRSHLRQVRPSPTS